MDRTSIWHRCCFRAIIGIFFLFTVAAVQYSRVFAQNSGVSSQKTEHLINPFLLGSTGLGNFTGAIYLGKNAFFQEGDLFAMQSVTDFPVTVLGIRNFTLPLFYSSVYAAGFYGKSVHLPYTFSRGIDPEAEAYFLGSDIQGWLIGIEGSLTTERVLTGNLFYANAYEAITEVKDARQKLIYRPESDLSFLDGDLYAATFRLNLVDDNDRPTAGIIAGFDYFGIYPTNTFAGFGTRNIYFNFYLPIGNLVFTGRTLTSVSQINTKSGFNTEEAKDTYQNECIDSAESSFSDEERSTLCQAFAEKFTENVRNINRYGLSVPLGGPFMMRSEGFLYHSGSLTLYQGLELRYIDPAFMNGNIEFAIFYEQGWVYDKDTSVEKKNSLSATGAGIRYILPEIIYRLDAAVSDSNTGVQLTLDRPW